MFIQEMDWVDDEIIQAFQKLIPQLNENCPPPDQASLLRMAVSETVFVFLAREDEPSGKIIGSATLATFETPTGKHGWIEDVVVDRSARRLGIGEALTQACLDKARELGLKAVNLTSRPERKAANQLYQKMGFSQRETNLYLYPLKSSGTS